MRDIYVVVPANAVVYGAADTFQGAAEMLPADDTCEVRNINLHEAGDSE